MKVELRVEVRKDISDTPNDTVYRAAIDHLLRRVSIVERWQVLLIYNPCLV